MTHISSNNDADALNISDKTLNTVNSSTDVSSNGMTNFGNSSSFVTFINSLYTVSPVVSDDNFNTSDSHSQNLFRKMQDNVAYLLSMNCYSRNIGEQNSITKIKWGYYQAMLAAHWKCRWPGNTWIQWQMSVPKVRKSLEKVPNYQGIDGQEDCQTPFKNRCELLDALIQRCFNEPASGQTCPGIPMTIKVSGKCKADPTNEFHDIRFHWDLDSDGVPILLHLTMICPFGS